MRHRRRIGCECVVSRGCLDTAEEENKGEQRTSKSICSLKYIIRSSVRPAYSLKLFSTVRNVSLLLATAIPPQCYKMIQWYPQCVCCFSKSDHCCLHTDPPGPSKHITLYCSSGLVLPCTVLESIQHHLALVSYNTPVPSCCVIDLCLAAKRYCTNNNSDWESTDSTL